MGRFGECSLLLLLYDDDCEKCLNETRSSLPAESALMSVSAAHFGDLVLLALGWEEGCSAWLSWELVADYFHSSVIVRLFNQEIGLSDLEKAEMIQLLYIFTARQRVVINTLQPCAMHPQAYGRTTTPKPWLPPDLSSFVASFGRVMVIVLSTHACGFTNHVLPRNYSESYGRKSQPPPPLRRTAFWATGASGKRT
jgi:hypothetical protein